MESVFLKLLNMSINASWLILAVILLRLLLKKAPRGMICSLWVLVALRLACPVTAESVLSLIPSAETVPEEILYADMPMIHSGISAVNKVVNPVLVQTMTPQVGDSVNPMQLLTGAAAYLWVSGMVLLALYSVVSYLRLYRRTRESILLEENVWLCDRIDTPFILGVVRPRIFLPSGIRKQDQQYVVAHERAHLKRRDHWWKPIGFIFLMIYWFNPIIWLAFVLLCRDIEYACDQRVIHRMGEDCKTAYCTALINCSVPGKPIAACPLAFGEIGVKRRIRSVLQDKKPAFWLILAAVVAGVVLAVCFLTDPVESSNQIGDAVVWVNTYSDVAIGQEKNPVEKTLEEFPGVTFYCTAGHVAAEYDGVSEVIISGMPIWNVCLSDLTGDGKPELCATVSYGSGLIDQHVIVVDYANKQTYTLWERGVYDYVLSVEQGWLLCEKREYLMEEPVTRGRLVLEQGKLVLEEEELPTANAMTLEDVRVLAKKGEEITWSDLMGFSGKNIGSGLDVLRYDITEMFYLMAGGIVSENETPQYIMLCANDGTDASVDLTCGDVERFIRQYRNAPVAKKLSFNWAVCPVGTHEDTVSKMIALGGVQEDVSLDHSNVQPILRVDSLSEMNAFRETMDSVMSFTRSYPDTASFYQMVPWYHEAFFQENSLFLIYTVAPTLQHRYQITDVSLCQGMLTVKGKSNEPEAGDAATEGWLLAVWVAKSELAAVTGLQVCELSVSA